MNKKNDTNEVSENPPRTLEELLSASISTKFHLLAHYTELARMLAYQLIDEEVASLAGARYERDRPYEGRYVRWGTNPGSIKLGDERLPIEVPRVRDRSDQVERPLESYQAMHAGLNVEALLEEDLLRKRLLKGLSTRDYGEVASAFVDSFGLSQSSVSRRFVERSRRALETFEARRFDEERFLALWLDGKYLAKEQIVIALGLTEDGRKLPLAFIQTTTENAGSIKGLLRSLIDRGFSFGEGLLVIIDGSKGLKKAVDEVFGDYGVVQRCQWHKRENVVSYLKPKDQNLYRGKLKRAYLEPGYEKAKAALLDIHKELKTLNRSAANSLMEGLEETLTIQRLGLHEDLSSILRTTNSIENLNSQLVKYLGRVKHWMDSDQRMRWVASALLEIEQRMRRIGFRDKLPLLENALRIELKKRSLP